MGKLKEMLYEKMNEAELTEEQEQQVLDALENVHCNCSIEKQIEDAINKVKHDMNNDAQVKFTKLELTNYKLKKALTDVLNFDYGSIDRAKALLDSLEQGAKNDKQR